MRHALSLVLIAIMIQLCVVPVSAQAEWTKHVENPVLAKSGVVLDWDYFCAADACVIRDGDTLKMWYTGSGTVFPDTTIAVRIGYACSTDGVNWTKWEGNPVLSPSPSDWDSLGIETVTVLKDTTMPEDERYRLWYAGSSDSVCGLYEIGYAFSPDGIHWTKYHGNPVLTRGPADSWENGGPEGPTVIKDGDTLRMWYAAVDTIPDGQPTDYHLNIGYAWSLDGIDWVKYVGNPVLTTGVFGTWEFAYVQDPCVVKKGSMYHMWYAGFDDYDVGGAQTGYAYSADGLNWFKSTGNPVLRRGDAGSWDANTASFPTVILGDSVVSMWYTGIDTYPTPEWPEPYYWDIGYAVSPLNSTGVIEEESDFRCRPQLMQNHPNPFSSRTTIDYFLPRPTHVEVAIYSISGARVRLLVREAHPAGHGTTSWDGRGEAGREVAAGLYVCKLTASGVTCTKGMLFLR